MVSQASGTSDLEYHEDPMQSWIAQDPVARTDLRLSEGPAFVRLLAALGSVTVWMCTRAKAKEPEMPIVQLRHVLGLHLLQEIQNVSQWLALVSSTEVGGRSLLRYQASGMVPFSFVNELTCDLNLFFDSHLVCPRCLAIASR